MSRKRPSAAEAAAPAPEPQPQPAYTIVKQYNGKFWQVFDSAGELVCLTVYKRGAAEVVRLLTL